MLLNQEREMQAQSEITKESARQQKHIYFSGANFNRGQNTGTLDPVPTDTGIWAVRCIRVPLFPKGLHTKGGHPGSVEAARASISVSDGV